MGAEREGRGAVRGAGGGGRISSALILLLHPHNVKRQI